MSDLIEQLCDTANLLSLDEHPVRARQVRRAAAELERLNTELGKCHEERLAKCLRDLPEVKEAFDRLAAIKRQFNWIATDISYKAPEQISVALFVDYLQMVEGLT